MGSIFSPPKAGEKTVFGVNLSDFELVLGVIWGDPKNGPKNISGHRSIVDRARILSCRTDPEINCEYELDVPPTVFLS